MSSLPANHSRFSLLSGGILGAVAVMAGAFGAHALKTRLGAPMLEIWETAARYQIYHAVALLAVAGLPVGNSARFAHWAARCFVLGVIIFSGSLYLLALTGTLWLGAITPLGGLFLIAGWILLAIAGWRLGQSKN